MKETREHAKRAFSIMVVLAQFVALTLKQHMEKSEKASFMFITFGNYQKLEKRTKLTQKMI